MSLINNYKPNKKRQMQCFILKMMLNEINYFSDRQHNNAQNIKVYNNLYQHKRKEKNKESVSDRN